LHAVNKWRQVAAGAVVAVGHAAAVEKDLSAFPAGEVVVALDLFPGALVDDRTGEIAAIERVADLEPLGGLDELFGKTVEDGLGDEDAAGRDAALAARLERAENGTRHAQIQA